MFNIFHVNKKGAMIRITCSVLAEPPLTLDTTHKGTVMLKTFPFHDIVKNDVASISSLLSRCWLRKAPGRLG